MRRFHPWRMRMQAWLIKKGTLFKLATVLCIIGLQGCEAKL